MRRYERQADVGVPDLYAGPVPEEWEYVRTRRRPGAPDGSLPVRLLLIEAGARRVDGRGPGAVSVNACARDIGVSSGAPYTWFADAADFRAAVAADLAASLVADLSAGPPLNSGPADPVEQLAADVGVIVADWAANGMGVDELFAVGGPGSRTELTWSVNRLIRHLAARAHCAVECDCSAAPEICHAQRPLVDTLLALGHGFAALARTAAGAGADAAVAAVASAVKQLLRGTA